MRNKINASIVKKLLLSLFLISLLLGFGFTSNLYISPSEGSLGQNCVEGFDININSSGSLILGADIEINSSMDYVDFVPNKEAFEYFLPPRVDKGIIVLGAFSMPGNEIMTDNITIGTLYLQNTSNNLDSFIKFIFNGVGITTDTNLSIGGGYDTLDKVSDGKYIIDGDPCTHNDLIEGGFGAIDYDTQMDELNKLLKKDSYIQAFKRFVATYIYVLLLFVVGIGIIIWFLIKRNRGKKVK